MLLRRMWDNMWGDMGFPVHWHYEFLFSLRKEHAIFTNPSQILFLKSLIAYIFLKINIEKRVLAPEKKNLSVSEQYLRENHIICA